MKRTMTRGIGLAVLMLSLVGIGVVAPAGPAEAQGLPSHVTFYQWDREIEIRSPWGNCDWVLEPTTYLNVPRGEQRSAPQANWGCSNGNGYIVGVNLSTHGQYRDDVIIDVQAQYWAEIVLWTPGGGMITCGTVGWYSNVNDYILTSGGFESWQFQTQFSPSRDCGSLGSVSVGLKMMEGGLAW